MDETDVGIELINRQNTENFHGGILIRDEKTSGIMKSFYDKIWDRSTQNSDMQKDGHQ
jgi:hypothetical protein